MVARNQAIVDQFHRRETHGIEEIPHSSRSVNLDSYDAEQAQPLHTTGNPDCGYVQLLFLASGPSGASSHSLDTIRHSGLTIVVFPVPEGEARRNGKSPQPTGCTSFFPHGGGSEATPPCACVPGLGVADGRRSRGTGRKRSEASFRCRGLATEDGLHLQVRRPPNN
jgi:hypothetical protein